MRIESDVVAVRGFNIHSEFALKDFLFLLRWAHSTAAVSIPRAVEVIDISTERLLSPANHNLHLARLPSCLKTIFYLCIGRRGALLLLIKLLLEICFWYRIYCPATVYQLRLCFCTLQRTLTYKWFFLWSLIIMELQSSCIPACTLARSQAGRSSADGEQVRKWTCCPFCPSSSVLLQ